MGNHLSRNHLNRNHHYSRLATTRLATTTVIGESGSNQPIHAQHLYKMTQNNNLLQKMLRDFTTGFSVVSHDNGWEDQVIEILCEDTASLEEFTNEYVYHILTPREIIRLKLRNFHGEIGCLGEYTVQANDLYANINQGNNGLVDFVGAYNDLISSYVDTVYHLTLAINKVWEEILEGDPGVRTFLRGVRYPMERHHLTSRG